MDDENENLSSAFNKLLVRCRLDMEADFAAGKKKKSVLWGKVLGKMKAANPEVTQSKEVLQRKFLNLMASYKRIQKRNSATGRDATSWDFFEEFDAVYGRRHSICPPVKNLESSLPSSNIIDVSLLDTNGSGSDIGSDSERSSKPKRRCKSNVNETLLFFKEEACKEQKRHVEVLELEREKLEIEKEKIKVILELAKVMEKRKET